MARLAAFLVALVALAAIGVAIAGLSARPAPADAALVFGNTVQTSGEPSRRLAARLETARDLKRRGLVRWILVSGGRGREGFDEAAVMKQELVRAGVADSVVIADSGGINTHATTRNARLLLAARGARSVDIVTQWFHVPRARLSAQRAGLDVRGAAFPRFFEPRDLYSLLRELAALPAYLLRGRAAYEPGADALSAAELEFQIHVYADRIRRMDAAGIAATFTDDGETVDGDQPPIHGPAAIRERLESFRDFHVEANTLEPDSVSAHGTEGRQAGTYWQRVRIPGGQVVEVHGRFVAVWVRQPGGEWRIRRMATVSGS